MDKRFSTSNLTHAKKLVFACFSFVFFALPAAAQVSVSVGVQEIYDDNIFLEDDGGLTAGALQAQQNAEAAGEPFEIPVDADGETNDDLITHAYVGLSSAKQLGDVAKLAAEGRVGAYVFNDESDENRLSLDTLLRLDASDAWLPKPLALSLASIISSGSNDITVAEGTVARQSQSHVAALDFGARGWRVAPKTDLGLGYSLTRNDFLGEFEFSNPKDDRLEEEGSDYFNNAIQTSVTQYLSDTFNIGVQASASALTFTNVQSNDLDNKSEDDLDRYQYTASTGFLYTPTEKLTVGANVGFDGSTFKEERDEIMVTLPDESGMPQTITSQPDKSDSTLAFSGNARYLLSTESSVSLRAAQSSGVDIDGDRLVVRSFGASGNQILGDRFEFILSGRLVQFENGGEIDEPTDRYEATATLKYSITEAIVLAAGYNFTAQDAPNTDEALIFRSQDYESHRAFISLSAGLVGTPKL